MASAGEKVRVILKNCSAWNTPTLRLRVLFAGKMLAVCPVEMGTESEFEAVGDDLVCVLNLCTDQAMKVFRRRPELDVMFILDDIGPDVRQMYFSEVHLLRGWPHEKTDTPIDLSGYPDRMASFEAAIAEARKDISEAIDEFGKAIEGKVDKVTGKGLSTIDATPELLGTLATKTELNAHASDDSSHVTAADRERWDAKAGKLDLVVQGGYLYVPDVKVGGWRRMQAMYNEEMGSVSTVLSEEMFIRNEDGSFVLEEK